MKKLFIWIISKFRKPKLEIKLQHVVTYSNGTEKILSEEEFHEETGCKITIKSKF